MRRLPATCLKKSTLRRLKERVTFTFSSRSTSWSGGGRKSLTTFALPISPSVYLIVLFLIDPFAFPPIASPDDTDTVRAIGEAHRQNLSIYNAKTEVPLLASA